MWLQKGNEFRISHQEMIKGMRVAGTGTALSYLDTLVIPSELGHADISLCIRLTAVCLSSQSLRTRRTRRTCEKAWRPPCATTLTHQPCSYAATAHTAGDLTGRRRKDRLSALTTCSR